TQGSGGGLEGSRLLPGHEYSRRPRQAGLSGSRNRGRKAEAAAADLVTSSWEWPSCDGGGGVGAPPACDFRKDAKCDRETSALLTRGFPVPAVADPTRVGQTAPARGHSLPFRSADHAAQDSNRERISVPEVSQFSQQRLTSIGHYESAWRTENTGSSPAWPASSVVQQDRTT